MHDIRGVGMRVERDGREHVIFFFFFTEALTVRWKVSMGWAEMGWSPPWSEARGQEKWD